MQIINAQVIAHFWLLKVIWLCIQSGYLRSSGFVFSLIFEAGIANLECKLATENY